MDQPYYNTIPTFLSYDTPSLLHVQIDYLAADKKVYWSDYSTNEIKRSGLSGGNIDVILDTGIYKNNLIFTFNLYVYIHTQVYSCPTMLFLNNFLLLLNFTYFSHHV